MSMTTEPSARTTSEAGVRTLLRLESLLVLLGATFLYGASGASWWLFASCFFLPDLALLGYLHDKRVGASAYNAAHSYVGAALLAGVGLMMEIEGAQALAWIWYAHIGFDRALGYGLKYATGFADTHLGRISTDQHHAANRSDRKWAIRSARLDEADMMNEYS